MPYTVQVDQFSGPFDALLKLIEAEELDISKISLAKIADDFIRYTEHPSDTTEETADFLVIACKLFLIKSFLLIPELQESEEETFLEERLKLYKEFRNAEKHIEELFQRRLVMVSRERIPESMRYEIPATLRLSAGKLHKAFISAWKIFDARAQLPKKTIAKIISLKDKIAHFKSLIDRARRFVFSETLRDSTREEIVVGFLAILELIRLKEVNVSQKTHFEEIIVRPVA
ncbi:MAG: segregation/condensation protein A [Parcubacteria group bacterium]|nr:segregation/condensation protein A [Parcubacteria group bacterium]